jgi:hypothetical protein
MIEGNDKAKIERIIERIMSGKFDDIDIDALLFELRDYSKKDSLFRELAHFIAHPEKDQGKIRDYIISYSQQVKFIWEYRIRRKELDLYKPFPLYILKLLYEAINKIDPMLLQTKFNITPRKLKKEIKKNIIENQVSNIAYLNNTISLLLMNAILYCLDRIGENTEILNQNQIIDDIIYTLKNNNFIFDENTFRKQNNNIMFCILILLHLKTLIIKKNGKELPYCSILIDKIGDKRKEIYLGLYGIMNSPEGDDIKIAFPLISTNLLMTEYCEKDILAEIINSNKNDEITRLLQFKNFKLTYAAGFNKQVQHLYNWQKLQRAF